MNNEIGIDNDKKSRNRLLAGDTAKADKADHLTFFLLLNFITYS